MIIINKFGPTLKYQIYSSGSGSPLKQGTLQNGDELEAYVPEGTYTVSFQNLDDNGNPIGSGINTGSIDSTVTIVLDVTKAS